MFKFRITASGKKFQQALKFLKSRDGKFSPSDKTWIVPGDYIGKSDCEFYGLEPVVPVQETDEAKLYRDWSDNPESRN
jgi:hypothetical protein